MRSAAERAGEELNPSRAFGLVARELRGGKTESWHLGAVAVTTPDGRLIARLGDPELATFLRSAAKPFQALPLVLAGGIESYGLSDADLALICASHAGCPEHTAGVSDLLQRGGFALADLVCGSHSPYDRACAARLREAGEAPSALHNNCSGKHAGLLLACRELALPAAGYTAVDHPLQRRIAAEVALWAGREGEAVPTAMDGCGVPAFHLSLRSLARAFAALAHPSAAGMDEAHAAAAGKIVHAMTSQPRMVAGEGPPVLGPQLISAHENSERACTKLGGRDHFGTASNLGRGAARRAA